MDLSFSELVQTKDERDRALSFIIEHCGEQAKSGKPLQVKVAHPKNQRSLQQNKLFHKLCLEASKQLDFFGEIRDPETWKRIFISGFVTATTREVTCIPGIEGEFVALCPSSTSFSVSRMNDLIDYVTAYLLDHGLELEDA